MELTNLLINKKNSQPSIEISTKMHLLEFSTVTHVVKNQKKWVMITRAEGTES